MTEFGREYGEGLYALCREEAIENPCLEELHTLQAAFRDNAAFLHLLANMTLSKEERVRIVDDTLKGQIHAYVLNFIKILVERGAIHSFPDCVKAYQESYNRDHQVAEAEVTTASPLNAEQKEKLLQKLRQISGREVALKEKIDPSVLGGVLLEMDGKRYDNTVQNRLKTIRRAMAGE
ncbi:MAG: ATP synthase F1 subunit delta [Clostridia bacterium]|nr:ATP synthase F1 subunit delta [Clostridia bacterium]